MAVKPLRKLHRLTEALERGEVALKTGGPSVEPVGVKKPMEAAEMARHAAEDAKGLLGRDKRRIVEIGPMLPFLKPGRVNHGVDG